MESSQLYAATLTHFSTEPLTTGPDYDPLLLLLALAGDVHPNPGPSTYPCSVCFRNVTSQGTSYLCTRCSHWVHSRCSGLRNAADYRKANSWICTACMTPPQPHAPSPPPSPAHTPTMSDKTFNILQWINKYLRDVSIYLKDNSLLISAPKSTVTLFTPDKHQFQTHPNITLEDTQLPLECSPKILGVIMDTSLSFHKHCNYVSERIDKRNNMLKALAGSSWDRRRRLY